MNIKNVRVGLASLLLCTGMLFVFVANAEDAKTQAPANSTTALDGGFADGDDAGDDAADADAGPPLAPVFDELPFSDEKTERPKKDEWKTAPEVVFTDRTMAAGWSCKTQRLREWIRISCPQMSTAQIVVMSGNPEDVFMELGQVPLDWGTFPEGGELTFAVRKGDRRMIEWQSVEFGYKGANSVVNFVTISEMWLPGDEKPLIYSR